MTPQPAPFDRNATETASRERAADGALDALRAEVERIDRALVELIAERVGIARRIGQLKRQSGAPTLDPAREAAVVRRNAELARSHGLPSEDLREVFWRIIGLCRRAQVEVP